MCFFELLIDIISLGTVVGKYTYIDANGIERSLSYRAGANIGFVPQDGNLLDGQIAAGFSSFGRRTSKLTKPRRQHNNNCLPHPQSVGNSNAIAVATRIAIRFRKIDRRHIRVMLKKVR